MMMIIMIIIVIVIMIVIVIVIVNGPSEPATWKHGWSKHGSSIIPSKHSQIASWTTLFTPTMFTQTMFSRRQVLYIPGVPQIAPGVATIVCRMGQISVRLEQIRCLHVWCHLNSCSSGKGAGQQESALWYIYIYIYR